MAPPGDSAMRKREAGFTLMEILLSVAILAVIVALVYGAYGGTERIVSSTVNEDRAYRTAGSALSTMAKDLASMAPAGDLFYLRSGGGFFPEAGQELRFLSASTVPFLEADFPGLSEVRYFLREGRERKGYDLVRREIPHRDPDSRDGEGGGFVLCEGVASLKFLFYRNGEEYEDWDTESAGGETKGKIPERMVLDLKLLNPGNEDRPFSFRTSVFIPLGAERG